jgi:Phycobilisome protein
MDHELEVMMRNAEGRYPTSEERRRALEIAKTFDVRFATCVSLEEKETDIVRQTSEQMLRKFPSFGERYLAKDKIERDLVITLRYIGHSILRNDPEFLREKLLYWMQSIFISKGFGDTVKGTYEILKQVIATELPSRDAADVNRYVDICIQSCERPQDRAEVA